MSEMTPEEEAQASLMADRRRAVKQTAGWQFLDEGLVRRRVPGGWLYRSRRTCIGHPQPPDVLQFVPDPDGERV